MDQMVSKFEMIMVYLLLCWSSSWWMSWRQWQYLTKFTALTTQPPCYPNGKWLVLKLFSENQTKWWWRLHL